MGDHSKNQKSKPFWNNISAVLLFIGWFFLFIAMILFHYGRPQITTGLERQTIAKFREVWDPTIAPYFLSIMIIILNTSIMGFIIDKFYIEGKNKRIHISFTILLFTSMMGLLYYFFN